MPVIEQVINEDRLTFTFPAGAMATKYDDWAHYRRQFNSAFGGTKAIDLLYAEDRVGWLVEIKDYRLHVRTKPTDIADEVAHKVRDTLAGLVSAQHHATDTDERRFARKCCVASGCGWCCILNSHERPVGCDQGPSIPQPCRFGCGGC